MSASREKKTRQDGGQGLTQKQIKEAKEAQAAKRNRVVYSVVGAVIVIAVAALLIWNSGFFQKRTTAATVGDVKLTVAQMQYYYGQARQNQVYQDQYMQQMYSQFGMSYTPEFDTAKSASEQVKDEATGQTWDAYFQETALNSARQITALVKAAEADKFALSAESKATAEENFKTLKSNVLKAGFNSFASYLHSNFGRYVDEGTYRSLTLDSTLASDYYNNHQESLNYSAEDLQAYADANPANIYSYDFRYYSVNGTAPSTKDDEGNTKDPTDEEKEAAKTEAKAKAEDIAKQLKAASDKATAFDTILKDVVGPTETTDADGKTTSTDPKATVQTNTQGVSISGSSYYEWLTDASRKAGDVSDVIESSSSYYVVLFEKRALDDAATQNVRHILIKAEAPVDDEATADVDESQGAPTQEALDAAKAKAEAILADFNAGDKTEDSFAKLANEKSEDTGSNTKGGLYTNVKQGSMVANFDSWIFDSARKSGDTGIVDNVAEGSSYYGYHVMYYVGQGAPYWQIEAISEKTSEDMEAWVESVEANYPVTAENGMSSVG